MPNLTRHLVPTLLAVAALGAVLPAAAQQRQAQRACAADVKKLCANVERGDGRIAQCLRDKADQLSPGCKAQLEKAAAGGARRPSPPDGPSSASRN
jgi:hypothetical protein